MVDEIYRESLRIQVLSNHVVAADADGGSGIAPQHL